MIVNSNGKLVPIEEATVSVMDHGFLYGIGLFETIRVYRGKLFLWEEHYQRLAAGLSDLRINFSAFDQSKLYDMIQQTRIANKLDDAYIRISVTAGNEGVGLVGSEYDKPSVFIFVKEVQPLTQPPRPKKLQSVSFPRQTAESLKRYKSHNYLNNALAKLEVGNDPTIEGMFLTSDGYVCEGIVSNLFWVTDGTLYTPALETGILGGITRMHVLQLAKELAIPCVEGFFGMNELLQADEVFVTNSIQEVVPVHAIDGQEIPNIYGVVTAKLHTAYRQSVELSD